MTETKESIPSVRYGHCPGHTEVCYDKTGRYILSCGADGDVRTWDGFDDSDAASYQIGETVYCVIYKNQKFYTASNMNSVQVFTFPDGTPDGLITRFTAPPTHICMNHSGSTLVAGASDFTIKIVDVASLSSKTLTGHEAPVLSVALHPEELFVASSSCDGTFRIWSITNQSCLKIWQGLEKCSDISLVKSLCRLCFDQNGNNLLVPIEKEIIVYSTKNWNKVATLTEPNIKESVSVLSFDPKWKVLAATCYDGLILLFDWDSKTCIKTYKHDRGITSFAWQPQKNNAIFADKQGQIALMENIVPSQAKKAASSESENDLNTVTENDLFDDMNDDDLLDGAIGPDIPEVDQGEISENEFNARIDSIFNEDEPKDENKNMSEEANSISKEAISDVPYREVPQVTPLQRAFQPASTPEHLTHRFMKWNSVGIIKQYNTESENSIDIEFHDTAIHHSMHLNNHVGYTMADLSKEAVVLASPINEDSNQSKMTCMHFASWDNGKEWSMTMPEGEEILAVTVGEGWIAAGTNKRLVRLFTLTGVQREIFSIAGPLVCLVAGTVQLMVVYHRGTGVPGDQCLGTDLYRVGRKRECLLKGDLLPLSAKSFLCWAGFSLEGTPFYMDSTGVVSMLNQSFGNSWTQVCHTKNHAQGKSDHYWIIGVVESQQQIRCILCKGSRFPPTLPRPVMGRLPLQLPLCELNTEKSLYEEKLWRMQFLQNTIDFCVADGKEFDQSAKEESMKSSKEELMKLFALSVRSDRECRALDICEMMPDQHTLQLAIKYASRLKRMQLAQRISELTQKRAVEEMERQVRPRRDYNGMDDDSEGEVEEDVEDVQPVCPKNWHIMKRNQSVLQSGRVNGIREKRSVDKEDEAEDDVDEEKNDDVDENDMETPEQEEEVDNDVDEEMEDDSEKKEENETSQNSNSTEHLVEEFLTSSVKSSLVNSPKGFPSSGKAINPFKVNTPQKPLPATKGTQVFDSMMKNKSNKISLFPANEETKSKNQKNLPTQMKLFSSTNNSCNENSAKKNTKASKANPKNASIKSGFPAWFKENKQELEEENPEMSPEDIKQLGMDKFKELPKEEKEIWEKKLKAESSESKKRKRTGKDDSQNATAANGSKENKKSKILSTSTNSKLASFIFKKD